MSSHPLPCPADHPIPLETPIEFFCPSCRTHHKLPSDFIDKIVLNSHGEFLDKILANMTATDRQLTEAIAQVTVILNHVTQPHDWHT